MHQEIKQNNVIVVSIPHRIVRNLVLSFIINAKYFVSLTIGLSSTFIYNYIILYML